MKLRPSPVLPVVLGTAESAGKSGGEGLVGSFAKRLSKVLLSREAAPHCTACGGAGIRRDLPRRSLSPLLLLFRRRRRWLCRGDGLGSGCNRGGNDPLDHVLLADRPEVGRD